MRDLDELKKAAAKILNDRKLIKMDKHLAIIKIIDEAFQSGASGESRILMGGEPVLPKLTEYSGLEKPRAPAPIIKRLGKIVDVIMPLYNADWIVQRTFDALFGQIYGNWRLGVVNDGSTDRSRDIAWNFAQMAGVERVKIFDGPNQGVASARNYARQMILSGMMIPGDYVAFMDADDLWDRDHLEYSIKYLTAHPKVDFVYSDVNHVFKDGSTAFPYGIAYHDVLDIKKLPVENPIFTSTVVCKEKLLQEIGEFDGTINGREDHDYWCRVAKAGFKMVHLKKILTTYTVNPEGVAGTWNNQKEQIFQQKRADEENNDLR